MASSRMCIFPTRLTGACTSPGSFLLGQCTRPTAISIISGLLSNPITTSRPHRPKSHLKPPPFPLFTPSRLPPLSCPAPPAHSRFRSTSARHPARPTPPSRTAPQTFCPPNPPKTYDPDLGLPFRSTPLSATEVRHFFPGPAAGDPVFVNALLRIQHGRRVAGLLEGTDITLDAEQEAKYGADLPERCLKWLREHVRMNEEAAVRRMVEGQKRREERDEVSKRERRGEFVPNAEVGRKGSVYGVSVLEGIRKRNEELARREEKRKEEVDGETSKEMGVVERIQKANQLAKQRPVSQNMKRYMAQAVLSDHKEPPAMSVWKRLGPSLLFTLLISYLSISIAYAYTPPPPTSRLFPSIPPAAATLLGIAALNTLVFLSWRIPPFWRLLNANFVISPGLPRSFSMLGAVFSHMSFIHLFSNMAILYIAGTRLHDVVGRGTFGAVLLTTGVWSSFLGLAISVPFPARMRIVSVGASGALFGVLAAYCALEWDVEKRFLGSPEGFPAFKPWMLLLGLAAFETIGLPAAVRRPQTAAVDSVTHISGLAVGTIMGLWLRWKRDREKAVETIRNE